MIKSAGRRVEAEARLGRKYLKSLRRELVRLAGIAEQGAGHALLEKVAGKLDEEELLALSGTYRRRMDEKYPPSPQLRPRPQPVQDEEDGAFLV